MSDKPIPPIVKNVLSEEQIQKISGGDCTLSDWLAATDQLRQAYDDLVDFTSYVIERTLS